jgi:hypothetical protein
MADIGNKGPFAGYFVSFAGGSVNQYATRIVMPQAGTITHVSAYFGGDGAPVTAAVCLWRADKALIAASSQFDAAAGSRSANGQAWHTKQITAYQAKKDEVLYVGFWRHPNEPVVFSYDTTGTAIRDAPTKTAPSHLTSGTITESGGAYATYTVGAIGGRAERWDGSAWVPVTVCERWDGSAWIGCTLERWDGSSWI